MTGIVLKESDLSIDDSDASERKLDVTHKFTELTYWNLDKIPSSDDKIIGAMQWIDIAHAVSS
jgi:Ribonuclease H2 non-catalytic subunit (Ylr154p-like)